MRNLLSVDFDGVIHNYSSGYEKKGEPIKGGLMPLAKQSLLDLKKQGYSLVLWTARIDLDRVKDWLNKYLPEWESIFDEVTNHKYPSLAYIDDRAIRFKSWKQTLEDINKI